MVYPTKGPSKLLDVPLKCPYFRTPLQCVFNELYGYKYCTYVYVFAMRHVDALWKVGGGKGGLGVTERHIHFPR